MSVDRDVNGFDMAKTGLTIHPDILTWARERRGYDIDTAAQKHRISADNLIELERGAIQPTPAKIRDAAGLYRVSPAVFFLSEVPETGFVPPKDFRTLGSAHADDFPPKLRDEIERVRSQQDYLRELAELGSFDLRPPELPAIDGSDVEAIAARLRTWLGIDQGLSKRRGDRRLPLSMWISAIEARGIFVCQVSGVPIADMRGFCLPDEFFPMVVLNGGDSSAGRLFTLLHELVHLLAGDASISNNLLSLASSESTCNAIAAAILMPQASMQSHPAVVATGSLHRWTTAELGLLAAAFSTSLEAVLRRLLTLGKTSTEHYQAI